MFQIVNTGDRTIRVNQIGWKTGLFSKRYAVQLFDSVLSSSLPIELAHGQEANWYVPLDARAEPWLIYFARGMLMPHHKIALVTLRAQFMTSVGYVFTAKPESNLLNKLKSACKNQVAKS